MMLLDRVRAASGSLRLWFGAGLPLGDLTRVLAARFGDRPALATRTYAQLERSVARLAAAYDVAPGERVAIVCANRIEVLLHVLALARAGAIPVPLNSRLRPEELQTLMKAARVDAVLADDDVPGARLLRTADVLADVRAHPKRRLDETVQENDVALLLATSGTTGTPKLARITSQALLGAIGRLHALPVGYKRGFRAGRDVMLMALPLTHIMGLAAALGALCAGIKLIALERFEASVVLERIERDRPNVFIGVPTMYSDLEAAGAAARDLSSIQLWVSAADVMPPERARRFQEYGSLGLKLGAAFVDIYGMAELAGPAAFRIYPPAGLPALGFVLPGFKARVVDADGRTLRMGAAGELQLRGAFAGYVGSEAPDWFATGDLARLGPGGTFALVGRTRDRLKVGGFSVFPAEVENELRGHPDVAELAVVGVPDARLGEVPVALVVTRDGLRADEFVAWAAERVAGYRRPRAALLIDALPRGANGKVDRRAATELARRQLSK